MLAPRDHLAYGSAGQIGRCQGRYPKFGSSQLAASKHLIQPLACPPDGDSLRHGLSVPCWVREPGSWPRPSSQSHPVRPGPQWSPDPHWQRVVVITRRILSDYPQSVDNYPKGAKASSLSHTNRFDPSRHLPLGACKHPSETCPPGTDSRNCCGWWLAWESQGWQR